MSVAAPPFSAAPSPFFAAADPSFEQQVSDEPDHVESSGSNARVETPSGRYVAPDGHLEEEVVPDGDRHVAVGIHLSPLAFVWIGPFAMAIPLILWLVRKDESQFVNDHGRETVNFMISFILLHILLALTVVGVVLIPVLWIVSIVSMIRAAVSASRNQYFRYPVTIRLV